MGLCLKGCSLITVPLSIDLHKEIEVGALNYWGVLACLGRVFLTSTWLGGGPFQKQHLYLSPALHDNKDSLIERDFHYVIKQWPISSFNFNERFSHPTQA